MKTRTEEVKNYFWPNNAKDEYGNRFPKTLCRYSGVIIDFEAAPNDFEFETFDARSGKKYLYVCNEIKPKGSIVIFPSFLRHRVTPVTKGLRNSLVMCQVMISHASSLLKAL